MLARLLASFLAEGSISYVYYAQRLIEFPIGIFAVALATVSMPSLSSQATAGDIEDVKGTLAYALRLVFFVMLPATAGLAALGLPLTAMLFQRGRYTHAMARETAHTSPPVGKLQSSAPSRPEMTKARSSQVPMAASCSPSPFTSSRTAICWT